MAGTLLPLMMTTARIFVLMIVGLRRRAGRMGYLRRIIRAFLRSSTSSTVIARIPATALYQNNS